MTLNQAPVTAFVSTVDLDRARAFYGDVLGLAVGSVDDFACVLHAANVTVRVTRVAELSPQPFTVLGWSVDDLEAAVQELTDKGVQFLRYDGMGQDELGVWQSPSGARIAWFADPDGNTLSLTQY